MIGSALEFLRAQPDVNQEQIALSGYCRGGGLTYMGLARYDGFSAGVVWHGSVPPEAQSIEAPVIILHGVSDPAISIDLVFELAKQLNAAGKSVQIKAYAGCQHAFTLPDGNVLDVKIPEGLADGQTIRLRGKGGEGFGGGPPGDALVTVTVAPHGFFRREGDDIHVELPITLDEAVLGGKVEVPTISGRVAMTIPKGASSGQVLRLRGKGVRRGDQLVTLKLVAPPAVDDELAAFFRRWRESHAYDPRKGVVP